MSDHPLEELSAFLDDELDGLRRAAVEEHMRQCPPCTRRLEELAAVDAVARGLKADAPEGYFEGLPARVRARLRPQPSRLRRPPAWAFAAAASLLVAVVAPIVLQERAAETPLAPIAAPAAPPAAAQAGQEEGPRLSEAPPASATTPAPPARAKRNEGEPDALKALGYTGERVIPQAEDKDVAEREARRDQAHGNFAAPPPAPAAARPVVTASGGRGPYAQQTQQAPQQTLVSADEVKKEVPSESVAGAAASSPHPVALAKEAEAARLADAQRKAEQGLRGGLSSGARQLAAPAETSFEALGRRRATSLEEARELRESWRRYARAHPEGERADEARVRAIEAGAEAYRRGRNAADLEVLRQDARAYLAARPAPQADRVRAILRAVGLASP